MRIDGLDVWVGAQSLWGFGIIREGESGGLVVWMITGSVGRQFRGWVGGSGVGNNGGGPLLG